MELTQWNLSPQSSVKIGVSSVNIFLFKIAGPSIIKHKSILMQSSFSVPITCVHRNISYQDWIPTTPHSFNEQKYLGAEGLIFFFSNTQESCASIEGLIYYSTVRQKHQYEKQHHPIWNKPTKVLQLTSNLYLFCKFTIRNDTSNLQNPIFRNIQTYTIQEVCAYISHLRLKHVIMVEYKR